MLIKRTLPLLLALCLLLALLPGGALAAQTVPTEGSCGENVTWSLDTKSGTLTISGTGPMEDFTFNDDEYGGSVELPWPRFQVKRVVIEEGVTHLSAYAFYEAGALASVSLPASLLSIGKQALCRNRSLSEITVAAGNTAFAVEDGVLFSADRSRLLCYPAKRTGVAYTIPSSVREIGDYAFSQAAVEELTLPAGLERIGAGAFQSSALKELTIPASVSVIEDACFQQCYTLTRVVLPESVKRIGSSAFNSCRDLVWDKLPAELEEIGELAFVNNCFPEELTLPAGLKSIGQQAFASASGLKVVRFPASVETLEESPFYWAADLERIEVDPASTALCSVDGVLFSKDMSLLYCYPCAKAGESYTIPEGVKRIGNSAFAWTPALFELRAPEGVTAIGFAAFYACTSLVRVELPASLKSVGSNAFRHDYPNYPISDIYYRGSEEQYAQIDFGEWNTFNRAYDVRVHCLNAMPAYRPGDVLAEGSSSTGIRWSLSFGGDLRIEGSGEIPGGTRLENGYDYDNSAIGWYEWSGYIRRVRIGEGVTAIGPNAFYGCWNLEGVSFPSTLTSIDNAAFPRNAMRTFCPRFRDVYYAGTQAAWETVEGTGSTGEYGGSEPLFYAGIYDEASGQVNVTPFVTFHFGETMPEPEPPLGDMDGDELLTAWDAPLLFTTVSAAAEAPDLNGDGCANSRDALLLFRRTAR